MALLRKYIENSEGTDLVIEVVYNTSTEVVDEIKSIYVRKHGLVIDVLEQFENTALPGGSMADLLCDSINWPYEYNCQFVYRDTFDYA